MTSKDRAKELLLKYYKEGIIPDDEAEQLYKYTELIYSLEELHEEMRNDSKYKDQMGEIDFYRGILKDKIKGTRDN